MLWSKRKPLLTTTERQIADATILKLNGTSWEWDPVAAIR
jgi:hypothetical protein